MRSQSSVPLTWFAGFLVFRIFNASITKTFFQPDEYWQSLEPAHEIAFGYGYLTWEWREGLRSAAHPMFFAFFYWIATTVFGVTSPDALVWVPSIVQATIAALGDYYFCILAQRTYPGNKKVFWYSAMITGGSAFNFFCSTRTFSNSMEMVLTTIALTYWPWSGNTLNWSTFTKSLVVASISCVFRPTNALIWGFLGLVLIKRSPYRAKIAGLSLIVVLLTFAANFGIDFMYFGRPVLPIVKFLQFNLFQSLAHFYGSMPWHYYLSQGLPILLIGFLPFTLVDLAKPKASISSGLITFIVLVYSLLRHKEFRFLYPILPVLHLRTLNSFLNPPAMIQKYATKTILISLCILNITVATFFNTVHQRGVIDVMKYLRNNKEVSSVGFLMPCHSTPWQSHLHLPSLREESNLWFLTCEPPLNMTAVERETYLDVADQFYLNPINYLNTHFPPVSGTPEEAFTYAWPSHLVFFEALEPTMTNYLQNSEYKEVSCLEFLLFILTSLVRPVFQLSFPRR